MRTMMANRVLWLAVIAGGMCARGWAQDKALPVPDEATKAAQDGSAPPVLPPPAPDAAAAPAESPGRAIFEQARGAIQRAQAITYHGKYYSTGTMATYTGTVTEGDLRLMRSPRGTKWLARAIGTASSKSVPQFEFDVSWRDVTNEWIDHKEKKVLEKPQMQSKGSAYSMASNIRLDDLLDPNPFKNELAAAAVYEVEAPVEFDGVTCDSVLVQSGRIKVRWLIGQQDHLPRKREAILSAAAASGTMVLELHEIKTDENKPPRMTEEMLRVAVPEGYTEDRPPPPPVAPVAPAVPDAPKGEVPSKGDVVPAPAPAVVEPPVPTVQRVPDFELTSTTGEKVSAASLRGKVAVLEFGGSWCLPLREAHPELQVMTEALKERGVAVYHVNVREKDPAANIERMVRDGKYTFGVLLKGDEVAKAFGIKRYPTYCVIDREGMIAATEAGFTKNTTLVAVRQAAEAAVGAASPGVSTAGK
jgi:thiol-disulfide isomerase/thioredoxin